MTESQKILLRRKQKVVMEKSECKQELENEAVLFSMLKNFESLGFSVSRELYECLAGKTKAYLEVFYKEVFPELKKLKGADVQYAPMYPNFPEQVMSKSEVELWINAIVHYATCGTWTPETEKEERLPLFDNTSLTILNVGKPEEIMEIASDILSAKTSVSVQDKEDLHMIAQENPKAFVLHLPETVPHKENAAYITKCMMEPPLCMYVGFNDLNRYMHTATDVLRLIAAMSDADTSLSKPFKCRSLKRNERRQIISLLENMNNITEDLFRHRMSWLHVCRYLHPFEMISHKLTYIAFQLLHCDIKPLMFAGKVQEALESGRTEDAAELLSARPGEFARNLDKLIRDAKYPMWVISKFATVAKDVSTPVLWQIIKHFEERAEAEKEIRVVIPKGKTSNAVAIPMPEKSIDTYLCNEVIKVCHAALQIQYSQREPMGKIYIAPEMQNYIVPFSQRSASKSVKTITRGSNIPIRNGADTIRAYIWWTNQDDNTGRYSDNRVDIDLTAALFDENWKYIEHVSYTNLRSDRIHAYHSGDIVDGGSVKGKGVAEFLDVNTKDASKYGRYIVFQVYNFTGQPFSSLQNCRFGWMEREDVNSGEIFEPKTVEMQMDITSDATISIPVIFDCKTKSFVWCDLAAKDRTFYGATGNNIESNLDGVIASCYAMVNLHKVNLNELIRENGKARGGIITENRNEADIIFDNDRTTPYVYVTQENPDGETKIIQKLKPEVPIITAYDTEYFAGNLL